VIIIPDRCWWIKDKRTGMLVTEVIYNKEGFDQALKDLLDKGFKIEDLDITEMPCEDISW